MAATVALNEPSRRAASALHDTAYQTEHREHDHGADECNGDHACEPGKRCRPSELVKELGADDRTHDADGDVAEETGARSANDDRGEEPGNETDDDECDDVHARDQCKNEPEACAVLARSSQLRREMRSTLIALILSTMTLGCGSEAAKPVETAKPATAAEPTGAGGHAADDKATDDLQAHRADQANAADRQATTDADAVKAHAAVQQQLQARFDAADRRFNESKEKAGKLKGANRKSVGAAVATVKTNEATTMASIAKLRDASLAQWDSAKARVDADSDALDSSIDALEKTIVR
jgi:hypothetical protein